MNMRQMRQRIMAPAVEAVDVLVAAGERDGDVLMRAWTSSVNEDAARQRECIRRVGEHVVADRLTAQMKPTTKKAKRVPAKFARRGYASILEAPAREGFDAMVAAIAWNDADTVRTDAYRPIVQAINEGSVDWSAYEGRLVRDLCHDLKVPEQMTLALEKSATGTEG